MIQLVVTPTWKNQLMNALVRWTDETGRDYQGVDPRHMPTAAPVHTAEGPAGTFSVWEVDGRYAITRDSRFPTRIDEHPLRDWSIARADRLANQVR